MAPTGRKPSCGDALDQLVSSELVFRRGVPPEATYSFKHALVQDAAYAVAAQAKRQQLHARIAQVLEEHFPEPAAAEPELLAHHFTEAGLAETGDPLLAAGRASSRERSANLEAVAHLQKGLELLADSARDGRERADEELDAADRARPGADGHQGLCCARVDESTPRASSCAAASGNDRASCSRRFGAVVFRV